MDEKLPKAHYIVYFNHLFLKENYLAYVSEAQLCLLKIKTSTSGLSNYISTCSAYSYIIGNSGETKSKQTVRWKRSTVNTLTNTPTNYHCQQMDFL